MSRLSDKKISELVEDVRKLWSPDKPKAEGSFTPPTLLGCPNCKSTNITKLWRAELVCYGDNSDNSTKGFRYGCRDCESIFYAR